MFKRLFLFAAAIALTLATCNAAHAQLAVEDPTLDGISIAELPMQQYQVQAQNVSLINQAKSYLLDTQEFIINHTDCGLLRVKEYELRAAAGAAKPWAE